MHTKHTVNNTFPHMIAQHQLILASIVQLMQELQIVDARHQYIIQKQNNLIYITPLPSVCPP